MHLPFFVYSRGVHLFLRFVLMALICACLTNCVSLNGSRHFTPPMTPKMISELQQGKRWFETGYYKHAMRMLLPLACDGVPEAQYAVGYMYYYGYGVAQDTDVGIFWITRAAEKGYLPAQRALSLTHKETPLIKKVNRKYPN